MASTTGWYSSTNTGAVGNDQSLNNSSGFNAFPEGSRYSSGSFGDGGYNAVFWSSNESSANNAWYSDLTNEESNLSSDDYFKQDGFSVRFVRD